VYETKVVTVILYTAPSYTGHAIIRHKV
jgi:hypothetical protein